MSLVLSLSSCGGGGSAPTEDTTIAAAPSPTPSPSPSPTPTPTPSPGPAPSSVQPGQLDINQFTMTFEETFRKPLDVTPWGPSKWIAHTFWNGDFGLARFMDPGPGYPIETGSDGGKIVARRNASGGWESALIGSLDNQGRGFEQALGYFEARMKLPGGEGVWPAFWLGSRGSGKEATEIDVIEYYGGYTSIYSSGVHSWPNSPEAKYSVTGHWNTVAPKIYDEFHTYGVEITKDAIIFYFDRKEYWRAPATTTSHLPMMMLVNLAINPDPAKDLNKTPNPSTLYVDYVRAYQRK